MTYKFTLDDGQERLIISHKLKDAIDDCCFIEQIREYEILQIEVVE